jgi:chromosome segregation protein
MPRGRRGCRGPHLGGTGTTPEALRESLGDLPDPLPRADRIEADVHRLRRQRDALGAVNLRAEEDARAVQEEHDTLLREKEDLEAAIAKLRSGIASLNKEGRAACSPPSSR